MAGQESRMALIQEAAEMEYDALELAHYKCDEEQDETCYAAQYGDGVASQHATLRELRRVLTMAPDPPTTTIEKLETMLRETAGVHLISRRGGDGGYYVTTHEASGGEREWGSGESLTAAIDFLYAAFVGEPEAAS